MVWNSVSSKMEFICKETKFVRKLKIKRYRWLATRLQLQLCYSLRFVVPEIFLRVVEVSSNILYSVIPWTNIREQCYIVASSTNLSTRSRSKIRRRSCTEAVIRPWKIYLYLSFLLCSRNSYPNHYSISIDRVSKESSRLKFRSLEKFRRISNTNSSNLRILLRINWSIDEDSSAFVASTMKWLFFFERRPRINERKKRERKEKNVFVPGFIVPRFLDDYIRLHKAIPFSNADCSAVVSMQNAPSSYMVAILCCCTRLSLWDLESRFTFPPPRTLTFQRKIYK